MLFCVVEALGNYLVKEGNPFQVLNDQLFGFSLQPHQVQKLAKWYRHLLAHAAMIAPGTYLTNEADGHLFEFVRDRFDVGGALSHDG